MNVTEEHLDLYRFRFATGIAGASISSLGYCLMIATAVIFPAWRNTRQNQLWLHMCGSYLFYECLGFYTFLYPIRDHTISAIVFHINMYVVRVSLLWMLAGAYLTYSNLVVIFFDPDNKFMFKATLFSWLLPMPVEIIIYTVYAFQFSYAIEHGLNVEVGCNYYEKDKLKNAFWITGCFLDNFFIIVPIFFSFCYYVSVAYSLIVNRKVMGHVRDLGSTVILGFFFVFTCCVQCSIISATMILSLDGMWNYLTIFLPSFHVSIYSILFIVCNNRTRQMWLGLMKNKLIKIKSNSSLQVTTV